jgi:hypothetical protein
MYPDIFEILKPLVGKRVRIESGHIVCDGTLERTTVTLPGQPISYTYHMRGEAFQVPGFRHENVFSILVERGTNGECVRIKL